MFCSFLNCGLLQTARGTVGTGCSGFTGWCSALFMIVEATGHVLDVHYVSQAIVSLDGNVTVVLPRFIFQLLHRFRDPKTEKQRVTRCVDRRKSCYMGRC